MEKQKKTVKSHIRQLLQMNMIYKTGFLCFCPRYMTTNMVSSWNFSTKSIFKHTQDLSQANSFTEVTSILNLENKTILWSLQCLAVIQRGVECSWVGISRTHVICQPRPKEDWHNALKITNPVTQILNLLNLQHFYSLILCFFFFNPLK